MAPRLLGVRLVTGLQRIERPEAVVLAVALAGIAAVGWLAQPLMLAVAIGLQLALGGLGSVTLLGPLRPGLGIGRYTTLAMVGVAITLAGRLLPGGVSLLLVPVVAIFLWSIIWLELRGWLSSSERTLLELTLTATLFAATAGLNALFPQQVWPPPVALVVVTGLVLALRATEARGYGGAASIGQTLLHGLAVAQVAFAVVLLGIPGLVGPALVALVFYTWGGAAEALLEGVAGRAVLIEFGSLAFLGLVVALLMHAR